MELRQIVRILKKHLLLIAIITILSTALGLLTYFLLPQKYTASGSLYIQRETEKSKGQFFTYEGYYGQQTAQNYTNTVIGLLESLDIRKQALEASGTPATEEALRRLNKIVRIKKASPQLVTLSVKDKNPADALNIWNNLSSTALSSAKNLNTQGDPFLSVTPIGEPVVKKNYTSLFIDALAGLAAGLLLGVTSAAFVEYFREEK